MENMKVLIVDDEIPIRDRLRAFSWDDHAYSVVGEAKNGKEALIKSQSLDVDIVVTDIGMPVMDGLTLIRALKETRPKVQSILLTCHCDFDYAKEAIELGACAYLVKGMYKEADLWAALDKAKEQLKKEQRLRSLDKETVQSSERFEINEAIRFISDHLGVPLSIKTVADKVGLSCNYFGRLFHDCTGEYFQDFLKRKRMEKAAELLRQTNLRIYEISEMVGIPNYRYFTDCFTKIYNQTPREFRG